MTSEQVDELRNNEELRKNLAKYMTSLCFRDSKLEDFHDRFSQAEIKEITKDFVNRSYFFLGIFFASDSGNDLIEYLKTEDQLPKWDDPKIPDEFTDGMSDTYDRVMNAVLEARSKIN